MMSNFTEYEINTIKKSWNITHKEKRNNFENIKKIRICAYLRKSQEDIKDNSLKLQLNEIDKFVKTINEAYQDEFIFYYDELDIFQEDNVSGMQGRLRPEFDKMLNIIEENPGYYGVCLVYKLDRFSRKLEDTLSFITLLSSKQCVLKALDFEDNGDPSSALLRNMLGIVAQYHAQNSAATSIKGTIKKVEEHKAVGLLPLGLIQEKQLMNDKSIKGASRIVIDPDKAPIIKDIFLKFSDGLGITEIEKYLKEKGFKNNLGKDITRQNIKYILTNRKYNGDYIYADPEKIRKRKYDNGVKKPDYYEFKNVLPKIIDDVLWHKVQMMLKTKTHHHQYSSTISNYILSDFVICGYCNNHLHGWSRPKYKGKIYADYVCVTHKKNIKLCPTKRVNKNYLELFINKLLSEIINKYFLNKSILEEYKKKKLNELKKEESVIIKEINNNEKKLDKLLDRMIEDDERKVFYESKFQEIEKVIKSLNNNIETIKNKKELVINNFTTIINNFNVNSQMLLDNYVQTKLMISQIIDKIILTNDFIKVKFKSEIFIEPDSERSK